VGWPSIEIYPLLGEEYWRPEYAKAWAQLDLLSAITERNAVENALLRLDGRGAARERDKELFDEFDELLTGRTSSDFQNHLWAPAEFRKLFWPGARDGSCRPPISK